MRFISTILYWIHIGVIIFGVVMGLFFSLPLCLLIIVLHRLHMVYLNDCLLFTIQKKIQGLPKELRFFPYAFSKTFSKNLSAKQAYQLDYLLVGTSVIIAIFL